MMADVELQKKGIQILSDTLGIVEAERFIYLMLKDPIDYTSWRQEFFKDLKREEFLNESEKFWSARKGLHPQGDN